VSITQIFNICISAVLFITVIRTLTKHKLNESNSILWLVIGFLIFITGVFPDIIDRIAGLLNISYPPTLLFLVTSVMLLLLAFKSSMDISRLEAKVTELAVSYSITNEENHQLKKQLAQYSKTEQKADETVQSPEGVSP
jgi:hypothetical protein